MPKINKSNRSLELPKLTVHLFEREVVEKNYLPNLFLTNPHSSENKPQDSQSSRQAQSSQCRPLSGHSAPVPCKGNYRIPVVVFSETHTNAEVLCRHTQQARKRKGSQHQFWWISGLRSNCNF